jgi:mannose-6-phosphate isomerase-like protein (cupin superfamily)
MAESKPSGGWTTAAMEARVVRYADLVPCRNAFIDTRSPGSEQKENFTIIGPGVAENPEQHVHISEAHGFNIGGARQPPRCVNSQHSHDTAEVFVVHSGRWRFMVGEHGKDAAVDLGPGDVISLPTNMFRGFENIGDETGFLFAVLGGDDPGRVLWAPQVFDLAEEHGLVLMEDGSLIDTVAGQQVPEGGRRMPRTSPEQVATLNIPSQDEAEKLVWRASGDKREKVVIGPEGAFTWDHGFRLIRVKADDREIPVPAAESQNVLFVHEGSVQLRWNGGALMLAAGDTMTVPLGVASTISSPGGATLFRIHR